MPLFIKVKHSCGEYLTSKPVLSEDKERIGMPVPYCEKCKGYVIGDRITQNSQEALKYCLEHIVVGNTSEK